jgi:cell division protein FtsL
MRVVVEPKGRGGLPFSVVLLELLPAAVVMALLSLVGIAHVTSRVLVVNMGYELSGLQSRLTDLERQNSELSVELTTLKSPGRLEAWARDHALGPPPATAVIHPKR